MVYCLHFINFFFVHKDNNEEEQMDDQESDEETEDIDETTFHRNHFEQKQKQPPRHSQQRTHIQQENSKNMPNSDEHSFDIGEPDYRKSKKTSKNVDRKTTQKREVVKNDQKREKLKNEILQKIDEFKQSNQDYKKVSKPPKVKELNVSTEASQQQKMSKPQKNKSKPKTFQKNHSLDRLHSESRSSAHQELKTPSQYASNQTYYPSEKDKNYYHSPNNSWFPQSPHPDPYKPNTYMPPTSYLYPNPYSNFQTVVSQPMSSLQTMSSPHSINYQMFAAGPGYMQNMPKMNNFNNFPVMSPPQNNFNFIGSPQYVKHSTFMVPPQQQNNYNSPYVVNNAQIQGYQQGNLNGFLGSQTPIIINNNVVSPAKKMNNNNNNMNFNENENYFVGQNKRNNNFAQQNTIKEDGGYVKIKDEIKKRDLSKSMSENNFENKKNNRNEVSENTLQNEYCEINGNSMPKNSKQNENSYEKDLNAKAGKPPLKNSVNKTDRGDKNDRISTKTNENFVISDEINSQKTLAELFLEKKSKLAEKLQKKDSEKQREKEGNNNETTSKRSKEDILKQRKELMSNYRKNNTAKSQEKNEFIKKAIEISVNPFENGQKVLSNNLRENQGEDRKKNAVSLEKTGVLQRLAMGIKPKVDSFKIFN